MPQAETPLLDMLRTAEGRVRLHMPGHKGRLPEAWLRAALDTTEIARTDDLFSPSDGIARAQALYAAVCGARSTIFLTGGSTAGVLAMLLYAAAPGGEVILPRNAHHSAMSACVWGDLSPVFVQPRLTPDGAPYLTAQDVLRTMDAHPRAKAVLLTRPDYYGICAQMAPVAARCHERGVLLCVDEAHGAHLPWQGEPQSAGALGADLWVQSAHKTLPALTGAAVLHAGAGVDTARLLRTVRMVHTSSPSFLAMGTLDGARALMDERGTELLERLHARIGAFWDRARAAGYANAHDAWEALGLACDPARIVVDCTPRGLTGWRAQELLDAQGIDAEMADDRRVVFIPSVMDEADWLERAALALASLPACGAAHAPVCAPPPLPVRAMRVREAALTPQENVPLSQAAGRVAAVSAGLYPPGVPLVTPGEEIPQEVVETMLRAAPRWRFGLQDDQIPCVRE